jgi:putative FmdB family regulatory protein
MPTYEYKCDACGHQFDQFQSIMAGSLRKCPACHKVALRRLIGAGAGLIFKGSGFYITDYRSDSYKTAAKNDSGSGSSSTADTAAKPAAATAKTVSSGDSKTTAALAPKPASKPAPAATGAGK